jgi:hypothetical protein
MTPVGPNVPTNPSRQMVAARVPGIAERTDGS